MKSGNSAGRNRGANRRRDSRQRRPAETHQKNRGAPPAAVTGQKPAGRGSYEFGGKAQKPARDRPVWKPSPVLDTPIPSPMCPICQKPIKDLAAALTDKKSGEAAHFDCIYEHITGAESLSTGEVISYIGGGRFGVVHFENNLPRSFKIKKVIEWEAPQTTRAEWRDSLANRFSFT